LSFGDLPWRHLFLQKLSDLRSIGITLRSRGVKINVGFDLVAHGGRYVFVSVVKDTITFKDPDFHRKEMTLFASRNATAEDFERVITAIREGDVPVDLLVTQRTTLAGAVADIPRWAKQKSGLIKALIDVGGPLDRLQLFSLRFGYGFVGFNGSFPGFCAVLCLSLHERQLFPHPHRGRMMAHPDDMKRQLHRHVRPQ